MKLIQLQDFENETNIQNPKSGANVKVVCCPDFHQMNADPSLFMAGGISNCPDWQSEMVEMIKSTNCEEEVVLINPRRADFNVDDDEMTEAQIKWEHLYLEDADAVSFWFPRHTVCPITLYELGISAAKGRKIYVGCDPEYTRLMDVIIQLRLERPDVVVHTSIQNMINEIVCDLRQGRLHTKKR